MEGNRGKTREQPNSRGRRGPWVRRPARGTCCQPPLHPAISPMRDANGRQRRAVTREPALHLTREGLRREMAHMAPAERGFPPSPAPSRDAVPSRCPQVTLSQPHSTTAPVSPLYRRRRMRQPAPGVPPAPRPFGLCSSHALLGPLPVARPGTPFPVGLREAHAPCGQRGEVEGGTRGSAGSCLRWLRPGTERRGGPGPGGGAGLWTRPRPCCRRRPSSSW